MEYYTIIKRNELAFWVLKWITLKNIEAKIKLLKDSVNKFVNSMDFTARLPELKLQLSINLTM